MSIGSPGVCAYRSLCQYYPDDDNTFSCAFKIGRAFIDLFNKTNHNGALDGNGRYIENFLTELLATRDVRLAELKAQGYTLDNDDLLTLTKEDIDTVINKRLI